jgi:hypothetical protein
MADQPTVPKEPRNVGTKTRIIVIPAKHPDTDAIARQGAVERRETSLSTCCS